jgi:hypothetical protein
MPTFNEMYARLRELQEKKIPVHVVTSKDAVYTVEARESGDRPAIVCSLPADGGHIYIHEDCWGEKQTCTGTRASGIYNGSPSIYDWFPKD